MAKSRHWVQPTEVTNTTDNEYEKIKKFIARQVLTTVTNFDNFVKYLWQ